MFLDAREAGAGDGDCSPGEGAAVGGGAVPGGEPHRLAERAPPSGRHQTTLRRDAPTTLNHEVSVRVFKATVVGAWKLF